MRTSRCHYFRFSVSEFLLERVKNDFMSDIATNLVFEISRRASRLKGGIGISKNNTLTSFINHILKEFFQMRDTLAFDRRCQFQELIRSSRYMLLYEKNNKAK